MKENKLIAEFMGLPFKMRDKETKLYYKVCEIPYPLQREHLESNYEEINLKYHESWDWLMPVVEKIECTTIDNDDNSDKFFNVMIEVFECNINGGDICICKSGNTKREATYKAVVEFINQYNKENESND